jgi:hypothetical protein
MDHPSNKRIPFQRGVFIKSLGQYTSVINALRE